MSLLHTSIFLLAVALIGAYLYARFALPDTSSSKKEIILRIRTWGWIILFLIPIFLASKNIALTLLAFISFVAFKEFMTLTPHRSQDRWALLWAYTAIPLQFFWAGISWYGMFIIFIPVYMFLFIPARLVLAGQPEGFLRSATTLHWGLMTTVFSLSHMGYLLALPSTALNGTPADGHSILFLLILLTQSNDIAQFVWGKTLGKRKITPSISPNKTWEGFLGGAGTTAVLAMLLAPLFTPATVPHALLLGLIVGIGGFLGDVTMSAIKRDIGIKDTGTLLPGHGGVLDRLDSLTFTAPLFFHTLYYLYF